MIASFLKTAQSSEISGTISVLHGTEFQAYRIGNNVYHVGALPWWVAISLWFEQVPWTVALAVLAICFMFAFWTRAWLRRRARERLRMVED